MLPSGLLATSHSISAGRRQRAGGVVRIADVDQAGRGAGGGHRLHIVGVAIVLHQRDADGFGADECGGAGARFITRIGHHKRTLGTGERQNRLVQGSAGTGVDPHVVRLDAFLLRQGSAAPGRLRCNGSARHVRSSCAAASRASLQGPSGFSLALRSTASGGALTLESCAMAGSLIERQRRSGGDHGGDPAEIAARKPAINQVTFQFVVQNVHRPP